MGGWPVGSPWASPSPLTQGGCDGSTQNPRTVKLTSDLTLTASFKTATTGGGGDQGGGTLGD